LYNVIELKNIHKSYLMGDNRLEVLKGISLTVKKGEFLAVLGPSVLVKVH
jgi:putative ABC transport system ATP-binding protein